jgi:hypothetical protein
MPNFLACIPLFLNECRQSFWTKKQVSEKQQWQIFMWPQVEVESSKSCVFALTDKIASALILSISASANNSFAQVLTDAYAEFVVSG